MTPCLAIARAPVRQRHADDGRQQLRRQPDRERDRKQQRLDHWPAESSFTVSTNRTMTTITRISR